MNITCPKQFEDNDFSRTQVCREGNVAIYKQEPVRLSYGPYYEVVVIEWKKRCEIKGPKGQINVIEAGEHYPGNSQWGQKGWTYTNLPEAKTKFAKVVKQEIKKLS